MANVTLVGSSTTPISLSSNDNFYLAATGSLLVTTGSAPALGLSSASANYVDAVIDGRLVSMTATSAIQFHSTSETTNAVNVITIGRNGFVSSSAGPFDGAISMIGSGNLVVNHGMIISEGRGITLEGETSVVRNLGTISAQSGAISVVGDNSRIINSGDVNGVLGLSVQGANTRIENSGRVEASNAASGGGTSAIFFADVSNSVFYNTGEVTAISGRGLNISLLALGLMQVNNSGTIIGQETAISSFGAGATLSLQNSGLISGARDGISISSGAGTLLNSATGRISSPGGDALSAAGKLDLVNLGEITASAPDGRAIVLGAGSGFSRIENHGTIATTFAEAIDASALLVGGPLFVTNHGTVLGGYDGSGARDVISNFGSMTFLVTQSGDDTLRNSGLIGDFALLGAGADIYRGALGRIEGYVDGGQDDDTLLGGGLDDDLRGESGNDAVEGREGNDALSGGAGADTLRGGSGDDTISAGADLDLMVGGTGADVFVFSTALDISNGTARDRITDFGSGGDKIDLSAFMAGASFIGSAGFSATGPEVRYNAANGQLSGDVDGNGVADWTLSLGGAPAVTVGMLIL